MIQLAILGQILESVALQALRGQSERSRQATVADGREVMSKQGLRTWVAISLYPWMVWMDHDWPKSVLLARLREAQLASLFASEWTPLEYPA